ncbi:MAG: hypothetical protein ACLGHZ_05440 [Actinomycetes bacterium]
MPQPALIPVFETLPGWPEVVEPGLFDTLALIVGWPVGIAAVITLAALGPAWFRRSQGASREVERAS